jgi:alpha-D-ribose 1-methylphosphonate 5-phosphate C-P lyase
MKFVVGAPWLTGGCQGARDYSLTYHLWTNVEMRHLDEPAPNPRLQLAELEHADDILVQYDEVRENHGRIRRRAYLLGANAGRIDANKKPHFIDPTRISAPRAIPTGESLSFVANAGPGFSTFATVTNGSRDFTIYRPGREESIYALPVYEDRSSTGVRLALTPFAVVGDAALFGAIAGALGWLDRETERENHGHIVFPYR